MSAGPRVVSADAAQAVPLAHLHQACFNPLPETPWSATALRTILRVPGTYGFVACTSDSSPTGLLIGRETAGDAEILTLCVAPAARRTGLARALFGAFEDRLPQPARIVLEVAVVNAAALALYDSLGFRQVGHRPDYYGVGGAKVDALILARGPGAE